MTIKKRTVTVVAALAVAMVIGMPTAGAAGRPVKVPTVHPEAQVHPCDTPDYPAKAYVWRGGSGSCREAVEAGAKVMWLPADAPPGMLKKAGL